MTAKVLVVDDSAIARKLISKLLDEQTDIELVGVAQSGEIALQKAKQLKPNIITLDVEMPGLDGLATLKLLKESHPEIKVLMVSAFTEAGAKSTLDALSLGAVDYITKPSSTNKANTKEQFANNLVTKVLGIQNDSYSDLDPSAAVPVTENIQLELAEVTKTNSIDLTVIGVSTGGPNALGSILPKIPKNFPTPILIVQHMPPTFTKILANRLNTNCQINVYEAEHNMTAKPGDAYIAPGDFHMTIKKDSGEWKIQLNQDQPLHSCRPAVDCLFESAVQETAGRLVGVIMTGMGCDGLDGCKAIRLAGGYVICQDELSSVVWGMPGAVVQNNLADYVHSLEQIVPGLTSLTTSMATTNEDKSL